MPQLAEKEKEKLIQVVYEYTIHLYTLGFGA